MPSSASRALKNAEIARRVAEYAATDGLGTLTNLALCCTFLSGAALDVIWNTVYSVVPLLLLLPVTVQADTRGEDARSGNKIQIQLKEVLDEYDWDRWMFYAGKVKNLFLESSPFEIHSWTIHSLLQAGRRRVLLPALGTLEIRSGADANTALPFISPSIRALMIASSDPVECSMILRAAHINAPNITAISLYGPLDASRLKAVSKFSNLYSVSIVDHSEEENEIILFSFYGMSSLHLTSLDISLTRQIHLSGLPLSEGFSTLEKLSLSCTLEQVSPVLRLMSAKSLRSVRITVQQADAAGEAMDTDLTPRRLSDLLHPLYESTEIIDFTFWCIMCSGHLKVDDQDMKVLAQAWPRIRSLHVQVAGATAPTGPSILSLASLARYNPSLHSLYISLGQADLPVVEDLPLVSHRLQRLVLCTASLQNVLQVAHYLVNLFPYLSQVLVACGQDCQYNLRHIHHDCNSALPEMVGFAQALRADYKRRLRLGADKDRD